MICGCGAAWGKADSEFLVFTSSEKDSDKRKG